jgi:hypothetical protein
LPSGIRSVVETERSLKKGDGKPMLTIKVRRGTRDYIICVPKDVDEVTVELPPNGSNHRDKEGPLIVLTDK